MPRKSHRRRQRERAQRREARRPRPAFWTGAAGGILRRSDLATITRAVRGSWPIASEAQPGIVAAVASSIESPDARTAIAAARAAIAMSEANARADGGAA